MGKFPVWEIFEISTWEIFPVWEIFCKQHFGDNLAKYYGDNARKGSLICTKNELHSWNLNKKIRKTVTSKKILSPQWKVMHFLVLGKCWLSKYDSKWIKFFFWKSNYEHKPSCELCFQRDFSCLPWFIACMSNVWCMLGDQVLLTVGVFLSNFPNGKISRLGNFRNFNFPFGKFLYRNFPNGK